MLPSLIERASAVRRCRIDETHTKDELRFLDLKAWLAGIDGLSGASITPASEDASFRRYFRVQIDKVSRIVMDAPPQQEDSRRFVQVAGYLERIGLNSPGVLAADLDRGFLLLTDLGSTPYLAALRANPASAARLYRDALQALITLQERGREFQSELPAYDRTMLLFELSLFRDWLCETHLQLEFNEQEQAAWTSCSAMLVDNALQQPSVFVHRDYHSRNLMVTKTNSPGILDFQDAVRGPMTYDLVSLLKDCYIKWPAEQVRAWAMDFYSGIDATIHGNMEVGAFIRSFELMGVQRHLKAAGIFARLCHRDGKSSYMGDVPRTLEYITAIAARYGELSFLSGLIVERVLPRLARNSHTLAR